MKSHKRERRKYQRFDLVTKVHFYVDYDLVTKVKFRLIGGRKTACAPGKWVGITRNVSAEGLRFSSDVALKKGDNLFIDLYLPGGRKPILMMGEVMWSKKIASYVNDVFKYDTGVKLLRLRRKSVAKSIHLDHKYNEPWSIVLEEVFGGFRKALHKVMVRAKSSSPAAILNATTRNNGSKNNP